MEYKMFSIRDTKAEVFFPPWYKQTHGEAERAFADIVSDDKSTIHKHPEDFDLFFVGTYDDQTGKITIPQAPEHIVKAVHFKQQ